MAVYLVTNKKAPEGTLPRMVEVRTAASAISHVARDEYGTTPISTAQAVSWSKKGVELEDPKATERPASEKGGEE